MRPRGVVSLAVLMLAGCATTPVPPASLSDTQAMIAPKVIFSVPSPAVLDQTANVTQSIIAHVRGQSFSFDVQIQLTPAELDLAALDGFGRRGLTVAWKANTVTATPAPWLPKFIRPADILADIALVYWPNSALANSLAVTGAVVAESASARRISANGRDVIAIDYGPGEGWNRSAKLRNLAFGYEIDIQSVEIAG
jgi:hypothetical protein